MPLTKKCCALMTHWPEESMLSGVFSNVWFQTSGAMVE
jgi:hypothetical protein